MKNAVSILLVLSLLIVSFSFSSAATPPVSEQGKPKAQNVLDAYQLTDQDIDVKAYGAKGDGKTNDEQAIKTAKEAAEASGKRLVFTPGEYNLKNSKFSFENTTTVVFQKGAVLSLNVQSVLVFNAVIQAGDYQIFKGESSIKIPSLSAGNPFWFGAKGDGVTDDTEAFKATWKVFSQINLPYTPKGYVITSINTTTNMALEGIGDRKPILIASHRTQKLFNVNNGGNISVNNIEFRMAAAPDYSAAFYFDTAKSYIEKVYITNCDFYDAYYVFTDARDKNVMMFMHFEDIYCKDGRSSTFDIQDFEGFIFMKRMTIDNSNSYKKHGIKQGFTAIKIDDVRGTIFENVTVIGANTGYEEEVGFELPGKVNYMASLWWDRVTVKDMGGYGIVFGKTYICTLVDTQILNCGGGVYSNGTAEIQMDRVVIKGNNDTDLGLSGITLRNTNHSQITDTVCTNNGGNGIELIASQSNTIIGCTLSNNTGRGCLISGGNKNLLLNSTCVGNAEAQVALVGEGNVVSNIVYTADGKIGSLKTSGRLG